MRLLFAVGLAVCLAAGMSAQNKPKKPADPQKRFARMDTDHDGRISLAEYQAAGKPGSADKRAKRFKKLDTNGDGYLSPEELAAGLKK